MKKTNIGILLVFAVIALVSVTSAALPTEVTATIHHPGPASYWNVDVASTIPGSSDIVTTPDYAGWCAESQMLMQNDKSYDFKVYSSLDSSLPGIIGTVKWNQVNYVLNHKDGADMFTIQAVIWHYDGGAHPWGTVDVAKYNALIAAADANPGYVPGVGENYAVILWSARTLQPVIIEVPIPDIPTPEFPTLALPIAMMIGAVGAVQFIKARKE